MRLAILFLFLLFSPALAAKEEIAIFAGGCFWSIEGAFDETPGVINAVSGYTGGTVPNPTYEQVSAQKTGHVEAVKVTYDPAKISYEKLLDIYWHNVDPFNDKGQFCDYGPEYRSEIFTLNEAQAKAANDSKLAVEKKLGKTPVTVIKPAVEFYPAEEYHQDYKKKNPEAYKRYRIGCQRDKISEKIWGAEAPKHSE